MHEAEEQRLASSTPGTFRTLKYFGKWPFNRSMGMQEVCSVAFSILNLLVHLFGLLGLIGHRVDEEIFVDKVGKDTRIMTLLWMIFSISHLFAWTCSSIFHARDTRLTERLDYCCADAVMALGFICATSRMLAEPWLWGLSHRLATRIRNLVIILTVLALSYHIHYMLAIKFDYGLNMTRCIALGAMTSLIWIIWLVLVRKQDHPAARILIVFLILAYAALLLEVLDFPPIFKLLDAHSLWHLCTIPLTFIFYRFIIVDLAHLQLQLHMHVPQSPQDPQEEGTLKGKRE